MNLAGDPRALFFLSFDQLVVHLGKDFFGKFAFGNINGRTDIARKGTIDVKPGHARVKHPPVLAVSTTETIFHAEGLAAIERFSIGLKASGLVFRMDALYPSASLLLLY